MKDDTHHQFWLFQLKSCFWGNFAGDATVPTLRYYVRFLVPTGRIYCTQPILDLAPALKFPHPRPNSPHTSLDLPWQSFSTFSGAFSLNERVYNALICFLVQVIVRCTEEFFRRSFSALGDAGSCGAYGGHRFTIAWTSVAQLSG